MLYLGPIFNQLVKITCHTIMGVFGSPVGVMGSYYPNIEAKCPKNNTILTLGGIHKLYKQDFANF